MSKEEFDEETLKRLGDLESMFEDDDNPDYNHITEIFGLDIKQLENEMLNQEQKVTIEYSHSDDNAFDPKYAYPTDSGFDLYSTEDIYVLPQDRALVPTGLHIDIPDGYEIQVRSKSGLALNQGLMVLNSPGTVDFGYTDSIKVIIFNTTTRGIEIKKGQKVAQAVLCPVVSGKWINFKKVDQIKDKERGNHGFGSTGI